MRQRRILGTLVSVLCLLTPCLAHHMAVVTDKENKIENVSSAHLAKIFKGEVKKWPDGRNLVVVMHSSSTDEIGTLSRLTKMSDAEIRAMIAERKDSIRRVATDAELIEAVASTPGAIGMVEERSITDRVRVIKVDGKLPMETGYLPH
ncbi:MAG: substrate-binding domain-containing protein [Terriglobales bacterium]